MEDEGALIGWSEKREFRFNKKYKTMYPRNENGVIFLFGVCYKDFYFEAVTFYNSYPDASAFFLPLKKRIKIEFEFTSSNFISHKHDFGETDLIICWKHDIFSMPKVVFEINSGLFFKRFKKDVVKIFKFKGLKRDFDRFKKFWEEIE